VDRNPHHVSFVVDPREDNATATAVADHAYWLSGLAVRKAGLGTIEALSQAFGQGDAAVQSLQTGGGALIGGEIPALAYVSRAQTWGPVPKTAVKNELVLTVTNLRTVTIDLARAHLTCAAKLAVKTDGPVTVTLGGCGKSLRFG
jgi:hypothetical protein